MKRTYYLRTEPKPGQKRGDPIACLMSEIDRTPGTIKYALSIGHPKDSFFKSRGRMIAAARLSEKPRAIHMKVPFSGHDISRIIMTDIVNSAESISRYSRQYIERYHKGDWFYHIPARVAMAASRWLAQAVIPKAIAPEKLHTDPQAVAIKEMVDGWFGERTTNGATTKEPEKTVEAKPVEYTFTNPKQQEAWDYFQEQLANMLANKYFVNKWALVAGREIVNVFDTSEAALNYAVPRYISNGMNNFIIQQVVKQKLILMVM